MLSWITACTSWAVISPDRTTAPAVRQPACDLVRVPPLASSGAPEVPGHLAPGPPATALVVANELLGYGRKGIAAGVISLTAVLSYNVNSGGSLPVHVSGKLSGLS